MVAVISESIPCYIALTYTAKKTLKDFELDINEILSAQDSFYVHIERGHSKNEELSLQIFFDLQANPVLKDYLPEPYMNFRCVFKEKALVVTAINFSLKGFGKENNRRISTQLHFFVENSINSPLPDDLVTTLNKLPVARERSQYIKSRLESWESYLLLLEAKAQNNEVTLNFDSVRVKSNMKSLVFDITDLEKTIGKKVIHANVKFIEKDEEIGKLNKINMNQKSIEVKLSEGYIDLLERNKWNPLEKGSIHISNYGDLSQVRRLRWGFRDLINGKAVNPNLEYLLFDEEPEISPSKLVEPLEFFSPQLDTYQKEAVIGAMQANDLYLIQGPPGTGKTTVITEICHQNVKKGLKTLVASQSNLAVDNVLSRLISNPEIRILRKGRTESIEEEGKNFIEENISRTWRYQTISSVESEIAKLKNTAEENEKRRTMLENLILINSSELENVRALKKLVPSLKKKKIEISNSINEQFLKRQISSAQIEKLEEQKHEIDKEIVSLKQEITNLVFLLVPGKLSEDFNKKQNDLKEKVNTYEALVYLHNLQNKHTKGIEHLIQLENKSNKIEQKKVLLKDLLKGIESCTFQQLNKKLKVVAKTGIDISQFFDSIKLIEATEKKKTAVNNSSSIRDLLIHEKSLKVLIANWESLLKDQGHDTTSIKEVFICSYDVESAKFTSEKIKEMGEIYLQYTLKRVSLIEKMSKILFDRLPKKVEEMIGHYRTTLEMKEYITNEQQKLKKWEENKLTLLDKYDKDLLKFKEDLKEYCIEMLKTITVKYTENKTLKSKVNEEVEDIQEVIETLEIVHDFKGDISSNITILKNQMMKLEQDINEFGSEEKQVQKIEQLINIQNQKLMKFENSLGNIKSSVESCVEEIRECKKGIQDKKAELAELNNKIEIDYDQQEMICLKEQGRLKQENEKIDKEVKKKNEELIQLKNEWLEQLENAKEHDLEEIKKLYIKYANVIGITCVQSAKKDFAEEYPDFDVVIIDEVSKATPPELLLPMLKGKKIILVGDHKQLPPLIGQDTLDETVENIINPEKQIEVKNILKESLFERLFTTLSSENKTTLKYQYRMHNDIMQTISQFYNEDGVGLICGLEDSDLQRNHRMNGKYVTEGQHLMWFDTPWEEDFFEKRDTGSTSTYNASELKIIESLLEDMNLAVENAKKIGGITAGEKKKVGIISFYGDQVRRLEDIIEGKNYDHLSFRLGTVDRFQGMEMDVIIVSFVRNHNNSSDGIGFAKDFRRLNVALSRARELLVIVGSTHMFTQKSKNPSAKKMYTNVAGIVQSKNGLRDYRGFVK